MPSWIDIVTSRDFAVSLSVAVLFFVLGKGWSALRRGWTVLVHPRRDFTLTGFWLGNCVLPNCSGYYVEVWKFVQRGSDVDIRMFAYSPDEPAIEPCAGSGVVRGGFFSALYYSCKPDSPDSGVMAMRVQNQRLVGAYAQYDSRDPLERFFASDGSYRLTRLRLPPGKALRMILGRPPFASYAEADNWYRRWCCLPAAPTTPTPAAKDPAP